MDVAQLVLEYVKVVASAPVIGGFCAMYFVRRFAKDIEGFLSRANGFKLFGGEVTASQSELNNAALGRPDIPATSTVPALESPATAAPPVLSGATTANADRDAARAAQEMAKLWEYRYINRYFAMTTQVAFDWLVFRDSRSLPTTVALFDAELQRHITNPDERTAIFGAMRNHHLIQLADQNLIIVTPKGRDYHAWRGPLPSPKDSGTPPAAPSPS